MEHNFWHQRWQENQIGFHQDDINPYLRRHWPELELPAGSKVFVPLCGKSRDLLWLRDQGYPVIGIELSPIAVEDFFTENGLQPTIGRGTRFTHYALQGLEILCGDFFDLQPTDVAGCAAIYDRASLVALPPEMRNRYVQHLQQIVPTDLPTLLVSVEYDQQEMDGPPFSVQPAEVTQLYGSRFQIRPLELIDVLMENPQFAKRGLTALHERIYLLAPG